ncbi:MAG: DUF1934 family protein [Bacilli bacterium]|nr:DUF1934 family protein [Bacilli bacterium]
MKTKIKASLKSEKENHIFKGYGIKNKNTITYNDNNIITKIILDNIITIERKEEYTLIIKMKEGINLEGKYITKYGNLKVETFTKEIKKEKNKIKIIYDLKVNNEYIDTFTYKLEYSIDS